jgi:hypothetical protein
MVTVLVLNMQSWTADMGWPSSLRVGRWVHNSCNARYEMLHRASELAGFCEHGNELSGSIKDGEFLILSFARRTLLHVVSWLVS